MASSVTEIAPAPSTEALVHFSRSLMFETDCWDTHEAISSGRADFVLLDVRGPTAYAAGHVPGAVNLPHGKITERRMAEWPRDTVFVTYCAGPHCNGAARGGDTSGRTRATGEDNDGRHHRMDRRGL